MEHTDSLFLESGLRWLAKKVNEFKIPLLASLLFGGLAYGFNLTNKLINHDEAASLFTKGATISSGRWGLDILERFFPNVSMPWIYGLIALVFIAIAVCLIVRLFDIRSRLVQILLAGSIAVFPSLTGTMAYTFTSAPFALSFLMAVLAAALIQNPTKFSVLPALACMVFSLSIYQSYVSLAAGLLLLILIQQLLQGDEVQKVLKKGVIYLVFLVVSLAGYLVATKLLQRILNVGFNSYASGNVAFQLSDLPARFGIAYQNFGRFFLEGFLGLIPTALSRCLHWIMAAAVIALLLISASRFRRELPRLLLFIVLLALLPLAINCMYLFTTEDAVHTLVLYGFVSFYVLSAILVDSCTPGLLQRISREAVSLAMAVIIICNIYVANAVSLNLYLRYENAFSFYTTLAADIKMMPEFDENTKVAIVGEYRSPAFFYENFADENALTGTAGFFPDNYSKTQFMEYYIGFPITFAADAEAAAIAATDEYAQMPCYPYYGSMRFIDDILVVKLS